jgi:hypothetical protein
MEVAPFNVGLENRAEHEEKLTDEQLKAQNDINYKVGHLTKCCDELRNPYIIGC